MRPATARARLAAPIITALAFGRAFGLSRFHDDWLPAAAADAAVRGHAVAVFIWSPLGRHWSPLAQAFEAVNMWTVGWRSDLLIRGTTAAMVVGGLMVFGWLMARLGASPAATVCGMGVLGLHHLNAAAYYSFDCYSQVAADFCTWTVLSLVLVWAVDHRRPPLRGGLAAAGVVCVASLLIKEVALAATAGLAVLTLWFSAAEPIDDRRPLWLLFAIALAASVVFAWLRVAAGLNIDTEGPASLCPTCMPGNVGLLLGGLVLPVRTLEVYFALIHPGSDVRHLVFGAGGASVVILFLVLGLAAYRREQTAGQRVLLMLALMIASFFPAALIAHVGELHAHTALFWFAALVACAVDGWRARMRTAGRARTHAPVVAAAAYVVALFVGLTANLAEMRATGERAAGWLNAFTAAIRTVPPGSTVLVRGLRDGKGPRDYSLYRLTTAGPLLGEWSGALQFVAPPGLTLVDEAGGRNLSEMVRQTPALFFADFGIDRVAVREAKPRL